MSKQILFNQWKKILAGIVGLSFRAWAKVTIRPRISFLFGNQTSLGPGLAVGWSVCHIFLKGGKVLTFIATIRALVSPMASWGLIRKLVFLFLSGVILDTPRGRLPAPTSPKIFGVKFAIKNWKKKPILLFLGQFDIFHTKMCQFEIFLRYRSANFYYFFTLKSANSTFFTLKYANLTLFKCWNVPIWDFMR